MSRWWAGLSNEGVFVMFRVEDIDYVQEDGSGIAVFLKNGQHFITETFDLEGFARHVLDKHSKTDTALQALNLATDQ